MKEINLAPYAFAVGEGTFDMRQFLSEAALSPLMKLGGLRLLETHNLVNRIRQHEGDSLLVDEKEYKQLVAVTKIPEMAGATMGFSANEVEMVRRILEAPDVDVKKKE